MTVRIDALAAGPLTPPRHLRPHADEFPQVQSLTFAAGLDDTCAVRHIAHIWESVEKDQASARADSIRTVRRLFDSEFESREI
jgi:hypothetical protein